MTIEPGRLIASGRAADIHDQGDGTVLRRYRTDHDVATEARVMNWLAEEGLPLPRVHHAGGGRDMVMDHVVGPTILEDLGRKPWLIGAHAHTMTQLQSRLNAITAPDWFPRREDVTPGDRVLHLDFHPMNIILGPDGPVIIDWTNAARGAADFDAAMSFVAMSTFEVDGVVDQVGRRILVEVFQRTRGVPAIRSQLPAAAAMRLKDPGVTDGERDAIAKLLE